jgi:hypothetical protein
MFRLYEFAGQKSMEVLIECYFEKTFTHGRYLIITLLETYAS